MNNRADEPNEGREGGRQLIPAAQRVPVMSDPYGPLALYPGSGAEIEFRSLNSQLLEYWRILNKRKWLILSVAAAFLSIGTVRTLMETPLYTAKVRVQIDREVNLTEGGSVMPNEGSISEFMRTQYQLLESRNMAERVASALKLADDHAFFKPREFSLVGTIIELFTAASNSNGGNVNEPARERRAASIVLANRTVQPVVGSRLVDVSYSDPTPSLAQRIADGYADAFIAANLDKRFQANSYAKTFLEDKIAQLKMRLAESERALITFAEKEEIVEVQAKESLTERNLSAANTLGTQAIANFRSQRNALSLQYEEQLKTFKPQYPTMVQIKTKIDEIDRQIEAETDTMHKQVEALKKELLDLQKRSIQYNILKREADTNRELYASLLQRYKEVDVASGVGANNVFVVDKATLPGSPSSPQLTRAMLLALALGLGVGISAAFVLEHLDDKIRTVEQAELITGLPTLGVVPNVRNVEEQLADPRSALSEAYRSLCTSLQFATENGVPRSLAVTSAGPAEGKSITSVMIAKHFARLGRKVLLIDADLRNPSLHVKLSHDNSVGLSNYLTGACTPPEVMQKTEVRNLAFIASGPLPPNSADLLGGARVLSLIAVGLEVFDLIVFDGPPVMNLADAQLLSSATAGTLFIVAAGTMRTGIIRGTLKRLHLSRGTLVGTVLTKYDAKTAGDSYGYGYDYAYGHGVPAKPEPSINNPSALKPQLVDLREKLSNLHERA